MPSAASLRLQIENELGSRIPGALTPRPRVIRDLTGTGVPELDALLEGGFPVGAIAEMVGPLSSGRTTLALATAAEMTQAGKTVAWVDASDALSPESAAAAGVELRRLLWVRCGHAPGLETAAPLPAQATGGAAFLTPSNNTAAPSGGCGSPHPRGEARGLSQAVDAFLHPDVFSRPAPPRDPAVPRKNRMVGTPSAPNRTLLDRVPQDPRPFPRRAKDREEQIPSDRQPTRRQVQEGQQRAGHKEGSLQAAQIANTAVAATSRQTPPPGHWSNNSNNAHGRALATPPNAIAAGLPRFREAEARAAAQLAPAPKMLPSAHIVPMPSVAEQGKSPSAAKQGASLAGERPARLSRASSPVWQALDQALRATDLLLAAGGFSAVVLDLGNIPAEFAWRIPLATWFRFRAAADRARTVLLVLTQHPCARSSAELVLRLSPVQAQSGPTVITGARFVVTVDRRRFEADAPPAPPSPATAPAANKLHLVSARKQPQRESAWQRATAWTYARPEKQSEAASERRAL